MSCVFCEIVLGRVAADVVYEDERTMAFLDTRPLFPGHTLVVPRVHVETLGELDAALIEPFFCGFATVGSCGAARHGRRGDLRRHQ